MDRDNLHGRLRPTIDAYIQAHTSTSDTDIKPAQIRRELQELLGLDLYRIRSTFDLEIQRRIEVFKRRETDGTHERVRAILEKKNQQINETTVVSAALNERCLSNIEIIDEEKKIEEALETNRDYLYLLPSRDLSDRVKWGSSSRHITYMRRGFERILAREGTIERQKFEYRQKHLARKKWLKEISKSGKVQSISGLARERLMTPELKTFFSHMEETRDRDTISLTMAVRVFWAYVRDNSVEKRNGSVICTDIMKPVFGETTNAREVCSCLTRNLLKQDSGDKYVTVPKIPKIWQYSADFGSPLNPGVRKRGPDAPSGWFI